jgi:hypothetical protein
VAFQELLVVHEKHGFQGRERSLLFLFFFLFFIFYFSSCFPFFNGVQSVVATLTFQRFLLISCGFTGPAVAVPLPLVPGEISF